MVKKIVKGKQIFARKAQLATKADKQVVTDLMDTLRENREICVGMAANMIGVNKSIIVMVQKILYVYRFASLVYHKGFFSNDILKNYILLNISLDYQSIKK
ncbi:peptide deformylase [Eubacterium ventriosum]|uniref:peptide deformylase n=1 Tax=Eubacterium ventriosum TaxID=39496 RepID=UPI003AB18EF1